MNKSGFMFHVAAFAAAALILCAASRTASATEFEGCGKIVQEQFCTFFQPDAGGSYLIDDLGGFEVGNRVHVVGEIETCFSPCFADCIFTSSVTKCIVGDLNGDGVVDVFDLLILLAEWGECADPDDCPADLDGNGVVDVFDLLILLANWS